MIHLRAIGQPHSNIFRRLPHETKVSAPSPTIGVQANSHVVVLGIYSTRQICALLLKLRRHILQRHTGTERQRIRQLESHVRVDIEHLHFGVHTLISSRPIVIVFGRHTKRHRDAEAEPHIVLDLVNQIHIGNRHPMLTTIFLRSLVLSESRVLIRRNFEIEIRHHGAHLHRRPG